MCRNRFSTAASCAAGVVLLAFGYARADVMLSGSAASFVQDYATNGSTYKNSRSPAGSVPDSAAVLGSSASTTDDLSGSRFSIGIAHSVDGYSDYTQSVGYLYFTPTDATTEYTLSGSYSDTAPGAELEVDLLDQTAGTFIEYGDYWNNLTPNATFTVGAGQRFTSLESGSTTGALTYGHLYQFHYMANMSVPPNSAGGTGTGHLNLTFTDSAIPAATPLPAPVWGGLALMGGVGLTMAQRRISGAGAQAPALAPARRVHQGRTSGWRG